MAEELTHLSPTGAARMVDVSGKPEVARQAVAAAFIRLQPGTLDLIRSHRMAKGEVLAVARVAGIQAAKQTHLLIPLCHQIPLTKVTVELEMEQSGIAITATVRTVARTGVEMEALTAVSVAALTIYDMCKAVDKTMEITGMRLVEKSKGQAAGAVEA